MRGRANQNHVFSKLPRRDLPLWKQIMNIKFNLKKNFAKETSTREKYHEYPEGGAFVSFASLQWPMMRQGNVAIPTLALERLTAPSQNKPSAAHLGLLSLCSDQHVLVMLCHFCKDPLEFSCRDLQGLQSLLRVPFIQGFINQTDGQNPYMQRDNFS